MKREQIKAEILKAIAQQKNVDDVVDNILKIVGIEPRILVNQEWEEDIDEKSGWSSWGWFYENGKMFNENGYILDEIVEYDKFNNPILAYFKYVG